MTKTFRGIMTEENHTKRTSHIPKNSILFEKIVPVSLIVMGLIMLGLILFAAGVLLGIVKF